MFALSDPIKPYPDYIIFLLTEQRLGVQQPEQEQQHQHGPEY